jgi:hypothetical protein
VPNSKKRAENPYLIDSEAYLVSVENLLPGSKLARWVKI